MKPRRRHWGVYKTSTGSLFDRYRYCYACNRWLRSSWEKPLIHKGGKP
jgi:hypothetical protein